MSQLRPRVLGRSSTPPVPPAAGRVDRSSSSAARGPIGAGSGTAGDVLASLKKRPVCPAGHTPRFQKIDNSPQRVGGLQVFSDNRNKRMWATRPWPEDAQIIGEVKWLGRSLP